MDKKIFSWSMMAFLMAFVLCFTLSSCGDDDDENSDPEGGEEKTEEVVNPSKVFTNGLPKNINGTEITTNAKGQVISMNDGETSVTFEYLTKSKPSQARRYAPSITYADVIMRVSDDYNYTVYYITLNENGFATHAEEYYSSNGREEKDDVMEFDYDNDNHLVKFTQLYEQPDITTITWKNGDITKVSFVEGGNSSESWTLTATYTNAAHSNGIENKGCLMFYDQIYGVDMDDMQYAYFAGLLGKAARHLPMSVTEREDGDEYNVTFEWILNSNGFPTSMKYIGAGEKDMEFTFTW